MSWVEQTSGNHWRVRYRREDGSIASECGFTSQKTAQSRAQEIDVDRRRDTFYDRTRGHITLNTWLPRWWTTLDLDEVTLDNYHYLVDRHIGPRFGTDPLHDILASDVNQWSTDLHAAGYEHSTVEGIIGLLSRILADAVDDGLLPANPVHRHHRRGKRAFRIPHEMLWATPEEVLRGAQQAEQLRDRASAVLIVTTAWTGCRWGEMAALQRRNTHLDDRVIIIDPKIGALKETSHRQWLGPPKTPASARTITLPAFLAILLKHHLDTHDSPFVFHNETGGYLWRHSWRSRTFNPAFDGNLDRTDPPGPGLPDQAWVDFPRTTTQPQNLAHRRRHPRSRASPTPGAPHGQTRRRGLQPRRRRSRSTTAGRPQTRVAQRPPHHRPTPHTATSHIPRRQHPTTTVCLSE
jgi:integrase